MGSGKKKCRHGLHRNLHREEVQAVAEVDHRESEHEETDRGEWSETIRLGSGFVGEHVIPASHDHQVAAIKGEFTQ
jgi:hypothetical protein